MKIIKFLFGDLKSSDSILKIISILYSITIATAWISYYDDKMCWYLIPLTLFIITLFYKIFDYTIKHKIYGFLLSVATFVMFFTIIIGGFIPMGEIDYDLSFAAWFLTPQAAIENTSTEYILAMYGIILIFTAGITYYFTITRYRIFANYLIVIIPFMNYAKEEKLMPLSLSIPAVLLFILVYILYSNTKYPTKKKPAYNYKMKKPILIVANLAIMLFFMTIVALLIPKPGYEAKRERLEAMLDLATLTDYLENSFNRFTDVSNGSVFFRRNNENPSPLFFVTANESLNLKAQTFDLYNFDTNQWTKSDNDNYDLYYKKWPNDLETMNPGAFAQAVYAACETDPNFAEKYNLTFVSEPVSQKENIVRIRHNYFITSFILNPTRSFYINLNDGKTYDEKDSVWRYKSGELRFRNTSTGPNENYKINYYSEKTDNNMQMILTQLSYEEYEDFLTDLTWALADDEDVFMQHQGIVRLYENDLEHTNEYFEPDISDIPQSIQNLANEITEGLNSDYEKALAIEQYFYDNDFTYDLEFKPKSGSNAETFLLKDKTGICFEYATSMTLLCRAAGLPARYVEGYNASTIYGEEDENGFNTYVVDSNSAHAFPEVFISGWGWMSFEPTVPAEEAPVSAIWAGLTNSKTMFTGIILLIISILLVILIVLFGPIVAHRLFLRKLYRSSKPFSLILMKLRNLTGLKNSSTGVEILQTAGGLQYSALCDKVLYGDYKLSPNEQKEFFDFYIAFSKQERDRKSLFKRRKKEQ
ncbi:MAG: transglutaminase-like domain-containing protein [Ruminococcus sp.]|jgi:hypothetical protein|nr:transglutaminase-like domain-containing protein [Ruminococcus sp.]